MKYFKNKELASIYHVSEKSVRNWINNTLEGKLDLQLYTEGNKNYIANITHNVTEIERIVEKGRKYKNSRSHKEIRPQSRFYALFRDEEIFDIIMQLDIRKEVSFHYCHFDNMIPVFVAYYDRLAKESTANNNMTMSHELLENNISFVINQLNDGEVVNIVELGGRDGTLIRSTLQKFYNKGIVRQFIDIDISDGLAQLAKRNLSKWFKNLKVETYHRDVTRHQIDDILMKNTIIKSDKKIRNIVFFLAGTPEAFIDQTHSFRVINKSLGKDDIFIHTAKLDTETSRRYFDFTSKFESNPLSEKERYMAELLGFVDGDLYEAQQFYSQEERCRLIRIKLKVSITLIFEFKNYHKEIEFNKGDVITFWRAWHLSPQERLDLLDRTGFDVLHSSRTKNNESMITISRIKQ